MSRKFYEVIVWKLPPNKGSGQMLAQCTAKREAWSLVRSWLKREPKWRFAVMAVG